MLFTVEQLNVVTRVLKSNKAPGISLPAVKEVITTMYEAILGMVQGLLAETSLPGELKFVVDVQGLFKAFMLSTGRDSRDGCVYCGNMYTIKYSWFEFERDE